MVFLTRWCHCFAAAFCLICLFCDDSGAAITLNLTADTVEGGSNAPVAAFESTNLQFLSENGVSGDYATDGGNLFRFSRDDSGSSGTGLIHPFLRIQDSPSEQGFNHDRTTAVFDEDTAHSTSLEIANVPTYTLGESDWKEFLLDTNEGGKTLISLNQLQIFAATSSVATSPTLMNSGIGTAGGIPFIEFNNAVEVFRLSDAITQYEVLIDSSLGAGGGSGNYNLRFFFNVEALASLGAEYTHFIVYSQFGNPPGGSASNSGFEEWSVGSASVASVPEPGSVTLVLLTALCAICFRFVRKGKASASARSPLNAHDAPAEGKLNAELSLLPSCP